MPGKSGLKPLDSLAIPSSAWEGDFLMYEVRVGTPFVPSSP